MERESGSDQEKAGGGGLPCVCLFARHVTSHAAPAEPVLRL